MGAVKLWKECCDMLDELGVTIEMIGLYDYRCYDDPPSIWKVMREDGVVAAAGTTFTDQSLIMIREDLTIEKMASVVVHELAHFTGSDEWGAIDIEVDVCSAYGFEYPW